MSNATAVPITTLGRMMCAFSECSAEVQRQVIDLASSIHDQMPVEEQELVLNTLIEALVPDDYSVEPAEEVDPDVEADLDRQEATFAARLEHWITEKGFTQEKLANEIGVGQPAISMMLSRQCRPQRRTVRRIAAALGIRPEDLWPEP